MNTIIENTLSTNQETIIESKRIETPQRSKFYRDVILNSAGEVIDENVWKPIVGNTKGRAFSGKLRRNGMQIVHLFDRSGFEEAKINYRAALKQAKLSERDAMIINAFQKVGVEQEPHIERALKDLLPLLAGASTAKATSIMKNVVKTVVNGIGMKNEIESEPTKPE